MTEIFHNPTLKTIDFLPEVLYFIETPTEASRVLRAGQHYVIFTGAE